MPARPADAKVTSLLDRHKAAGDLHDRRRRLSGRSRFSETALPLRASGNGEKVSPSPRTDLRRGVRLLSRVRAWMCVPPMDFA